ncbi:MAG: glycoside hydrolase family 52 protein [Kiritimatiellia bacterium]
MSIFFNAFHAPVGAHASFTLGCHGQRGGLGLELGKPADENVYIGVETRQGGSYQALPFFTGAADEAARYDHAAGKREQEQLLSPFARDAISRDYRLGSDTWTAGDLSFTIHAPVESAPDPVKTSRAQQQAVYRPSVLAELTIDNRRGKRARRAFFGYAGANNNDSTRWINEPGFKGIAKGQNTGIFCDDPGAVPARGFNAERILKERHPENYTEGLGGTGLLLLEVPAGRRKTFRFAVCFYRGGIVTTGMPASYWYTRFFKDVESVGRYTLRHFGDIRRRAIASERLIASRKLSGAQRFQMIHAIRSYYGSTQLLEHRGKPVWIVNEGEYRMMNTFDLTVDQVFYEMKMNPWTVRNELDLFTSRYSYTDRLHFPGGANDQRGGLSFNHDMGCRNHFSRPAYSSYERFGLTGCFSHMTHEQLVNWILCAAVYYRGSGDRRWMQANLPVLKKCLASMLNRDHPRDAGRNGIMGLDSDRTLDGAEITTYDSLDVSLGQARNNVYIGVKGWAAYLVMENIFKAFHWPREASRAALQARRAADTIAGHLNDEGFIPAIMGEACDSRIIPAIEGLVFPWVMNDPVALDDTGPYAHLIKALKQHFETVFREGVCIYPDHGWKLSSTADNSWLSKIYLCQFVARKILGFRNNATGKDADEAHRGWLLNSENLYHAWSDQMSSGVAKGSKYYPRGVTSILWLEE